MTNTKQTIEKKYGLASAPVCRKPVCALMHRGLSKVEYLCDCGDWHPIENHPKDTQNH